MKKTMILAVVVACVLGGRPAIAQVPYDRIVKAESEPANWLTYAGSYKSQRCSSSIRSINRTCRS